VEQKSFSCNKHRSSAPSFAQAHPSTSRELTQASVCPIKESYE